MSLADYHSAAPASTFAASPVAKANPVAITKRAASRDIRNIEPTPCLTDIPRMTPPDFPEP